jgi:hypothetical protein
VHEEFREEEKKKKTKKNEQTRICLCRCHQPHSGSCVDPFTTFFTATDSINASNGKGTIVERRRTIGGKTRYGTDRAGNGSMSLAWTCQTLFGSSPRTRYVFVPRR